MTTRGYVICSHPRSGSNYLCELLASTGTLGHPQDWFNASGIRARGDADYPLAPRAQLDQLRTRGATPNGVYGMKMFCTTIDSLGGLDWVAELPGLRWIYLERLDLLSQALSDVRSTQTQQYRSTARVKAEPRFDARAIGDSLARTAREAGRWKLFFGRNGISPLPLTYEGIAADPQGTVDAIARLVGLDVPQPIRQDHLTLRVQRDALTDTWRERYLAREADLARFDALPSAVTLWARRKLARIAKGTHDD